MNLGHITVITQPDRFFNLDSNYLLVNPSATMLEQFHMLVESVYEPLNVFVYDTASTDIEWLLSVSCQADMVIIDIDNCTPDTKPFVTFLLTHPGAFYMTSDELTPYNLISKNRIFDLDWVVSPDEDSDDLEDDDEQPQD